MLRSNIINVEKIRSDFPILSRKVNGKPLIYFDNAATSHKPKTVIDAVREYYEVYNSNIHRGIYRLSEESTEAYEKARDKIARLINAESREEIIFVRGTTEAINLVAYSWGRSNVNEGDIILITQMEHHSNIVPWQILVKEKKAELEYIGVDDGGQLIQEDFEKHMAKSPKLVGITQMSNVLGTINPVKEMVRKAHDNGSAVLVDGAQSVPHMPVDVQDLDCDFLAFSGHKMLGPTGIGILYAKKEVLNDMPPFQGGGEMIKEVHLRETRWNDLPWKFEAGTTNIAGGIGLGVAVDYLTRLDLKNIRRHEKELTEYVLESMSRFEDVIIYGTLDTEIRGGAVSFNLGDIHPHDVASILDSEGIAIRSGHHCAQPLMERLNVPATNRASVYIYNTEEEVDVFVKALDKVRRMFST